MPRLEHAGVPEQYAAHTRKRVCSVLGLALLCGMLLVAAVSLGSVRVPVADVARAMANMETDPRYRIIVREIRLPHALAALLAGAGLAGAGTAMQSILRNPLGSPFTLGISQAGAFGAAFAVMLLGSGAMQSTQAGAVKIINPYLTTLCAFAACVAASLVIVALARFRGATPEVMVLSGVALGSLFSAATMFLQYFADDAQLAAMVFWTFGDVGRAGWREIAFMGAVVAPGIAFFAANRWTYNAIDAGDETARSIGIRVERARLMGMGVASLITAFIVSFLGVIGFVGLIAPHIVRRLVGDDHRFAMPAACLAGAGLLLASDIAARLVLAPHLLPVAILTAFVGAPTFLYLLVRDRRR